MDKESANFCRVLSWVKQCIFATGPVVATKQCLSPAPTTTAHDRRVVARFDNEIGSIGDQLAIHSVYALQRAFDLIWCIVRGLQPPNRGINQHPQLGDICWHGLSEEK